MSAEEIALASDVIRMLTVTDAERERIKGFEQGTPEWLASRALRVTVSNAGTVVGNSRYCTPAKYARELAAIPEPKAPNAAMTWGSTNEDKACDTYTTIMQVKMEEMGRDPTKFVVRHCGLVIDKDNPWLGASPDGIVDTGCAEDGLGLLEIKCPYTKRLYACTPAQYYDQIQAQMAILGCAWCDFAVWTPTDMNVWRYKFDADYWNTFLFPGLKQFYFDTFLPMYTHAVLVTKTSLPPDEHIERMLAVAAQSKRQQPQQP